MSAYYLWSNGLYKMVQWNSPLPDALHQRPTPIKVIKNTGRKILIASICCIASSKYIDEQSTVLGGLPLSPLLSLAGYALLALFGAISLQAVVVGVQQPPAWEKSLDDRQRRLLGLEPKAVKPTARPGAVGAAGVLLRPPERGGYAAPANVTPIHVKDKQPQVSPAPRSAGREIATPEQLQRVLQEFDEQTETGGAGMAAPEFAPYGSPQQPLPSASTYRPSLIPKGYEALPIRGDGRIAESLPEQKRAAMRRLGVSQAGLETGVERLREWFAEKVLHPLDRAIRTAHLDVMNSAARIGMATGFRVSALDDTNTSNSVADDSVSVNNLMLELTRRLQSLGNVQPPQEALACLEAINRYNKLIALLRGDFPTGLLPTPPDGYIVSRIQDLSEGTCMMAFAWNSGGRWNGKAWTPDLPTDSALVLYLFSAFLAAPGWIFPQGDASPVEGPSGILYLGKLPPKPAGEFYAILSARPPAESKVTGILGLQLGSQQPHFSFIVGGKTLLTLSDHLSLFELFYLFLVHCRSTGGVVGSRSMEYIGLDDVVQAPKPSWSDIGWEALRATRLLVWPNNDTN